jgi:hypothetical protein
MHSLSRELNYQSKPKARATPYPVCCRLAFSPTPRYCCAMIINTCYNNIMLFNGSIALGGEDGDW